MVSIFCRLEIHGKNGPSLVLFLLGFLGDFMYITSGLD